MSERHSSTLALTSARGLAAWWVVLYHFKEATGLLESSLIYSFISKGHLAVDFFFILSGFVIYLNYGGWFFVLSKKAYFKFIAFRLARVYPLYLAVLFLFLLNPLAIYFFSSSGDVGERYGLSYFFASIFMVQNWGGYKDLGWNIPGWSISVEFAAYLLFPVISYFVSKLRVNWFICVIALIIAGAMLKYLHWFFGYFSLGDGITSTGLFRCLIQFSLGCVLARFYKEGFVDSINWLAFIVFVIFFGFFFGFGFVSDFYAIPIAFSSVIVFLLKYKKNTFVISPLVWLGEISYSTYIIHYFIKDWIKFLGGNIGVYQFFLYLFFVLILSIILYRFIEVPGRNYFKKLTNKVMV